MSEIHIEGDKIIISPGGSKSGKKRKREAKSDPGAQVLFTAFVLFAIAARMFGWM